MTRTHFYQVTSIGGGDEFIGGMGPVPEGVAIRYPTGQDYLLAASEIEWEREAGRTKVIIDS